MVLNKVSSHSLFPHPLCLLSILSQYIYIWSSKISFRTDYHVRTIEQVYSINKEYETCYLLSPAAMMAHRKDGQKFLHIGLVQVGVKPLIREGLYIYKSGLKYHIDQLVCEFSVYKPC